MDILLWGVGGGISCSKISQCGYEIPSDLVAGFHHVWSGPHPQELVLKITPSSRIGPTPTPSCATHYPAGQRGGQTHPRLRAQFWSEHEHRRAMGSPGCTAGAHNISISSRESLLGRSQLMVRTAVWLAGRQDRLLPMPVQSFCLSGRATLSYRRQGLTPQEAAAQAWVRDEQSDGKEARLPTVQSPPLGPSTPDSQAFVEDTPCQHVEGTLTRLQDQGCFQQQQGIHLAGRQEASGPGQCRGRGPQGRGAGPNRHYFGFVHSPEGVEDSVQVAGVVLQMPHAPLPLLVQLFPRSLLRRAETPSAPLAAREEAASLTSSGSPLGTGETAAYKTPGFREQQKPKRKKGEIPSSKTLLAVQTAAWP